MRQPALKSQEGKEPGAGKTAPLPPETPISGLRLQASRFLGFLAFRETGRMNLAAPAALLFASGLASLVYQMLWVKQLSLMVGVEVQAITTAVGAFFGGLAVGGYVWGRLADRIRRPLFFYAILEIAVAILAVGASFGLAKGPPLFAYLEARIGPFAWLLPFLLVGAPALLMGGTLPVLMRSFAPQAEKLGLAGGRLYAANTSGAIAGALLTSFLLIPTLGMRGATLAAGAINLVTALVAFAMSCSIHARNIVHRLSPVSSSSTGSGLALVLYAIAGGIALGYEVIWSQTMVQWTSTRTFAFSVVLATYLTGLAIGSAWFACRADRSREPWGDFGLLIAATGLVALLSTTFAGPWLPALQVKAATLAFAVAHQEPIAMAARFAVAAICIVLLPTILLGAAFPAALRLTADTASPGRDTGKIIALNTAGGIAGTLFTGFILVPALGLERSLAMLAVSAGLVGSIAVLRGTGARQGLRWATLACGAVTVLAAVLISPDHLAQLLASARGGKLLFLEAGSGGTVAVIEQRSAQNRFRRLYIQGVSNSGDSLSSLRYMRLQALLPLMIHRGEPRSALVIGLGTGITAGGLLCYPGLDRRVCAELLPAVVRAASQFSGNHGVTADPRMTLRLSDGRRELLRNPETYDLITLEPPPPSNAGVVNLYSRDFYRLAASRLNPDGLVAQWLPLATQTNAETRSLVRSFLDVFPQATLWTTELHEMLLVGSLAPIELDAGRIAARFNQPEVGSALREVGIASPAALMATWVTDRAGLEHYAGDAPPVTDDRPRIEYGSWVMPGEFARSLPQIMELRTDPPLVGSDAEFGAAVEHERTLLLSFYEAGIYAYQGDQGHWQETMAWVLRRDPDNPYYRWFVGNDSLEQPERKKFP
jgi:spermidine synthase